MKAKNKCKLTQLLVKRLKATAGRPVLVWDTLCYGLVLCIQPSGRRSYRFFYSIRGQARWYHIGWVYLKEAREIGFGLRAEIAKGHDPWAERRKITLKQNNSFAGVHRRYVTEHAVKENKSWKQGDRLIRRYVLPKWSKLDPASITRADVKAMLGRIEAPILARQVMLATSAVFKWAIAEDLVSVNPCKGITRAKSLSRSRVLSDTEIAAFWKEFENLDPIRGGALKTLLLTGQRKSEVSCMRWEHIKDGWWWNLPGAEIAELGWPGTKSGGDNRIWLPQGVQDIIATQRAHSGFVFATARNRAISGLDAAMRSICTKLGCEPAIVHDLRRTHGTTITKMGFGTDAMNRIQNHKEGGVTSVYDRYKYERETQTIMERVGQYLVATAAGSGGDTVVLPFGKLEKSS